MFTFLRKGNTEAVSHKVLQHIYEFSGDFRLQKTRFWSEQILQTQA